MEKRLSLTVSIKQSETPTPAIISLLKNTLWGTPGETQYQHLETEKTIFDIKSPVYFRLERFDNLLCTVCLAGRKVNIEEKLTDSHYVRYLAASPSINGNGRRKKTAEQKESKGFVKQFMEEVFLKEARENHKPLFYAYVESDNEQSKHLCNYYGFRSVSTMTTIAFSRFSPKKSENIRRVKPEEKSSILDAIIGQYPNHNFLYFEHIFYEENYFVAEADGMIVAGVQSNPMRWAFRNLPGISGKVLLKILPYIPYLKRLINPKEFKFSAFEGIFCKPGYEWILNNLFESVISEQGNHTALIWLDVQSPMIKIIRKRCKLGLMDKINDNGAGEIVVRGENLSESDWLSLKNKPMYVSSFDFN
jgi:hypothetical protein